MTGGLLFAIVGVALFAMGAGGVLLLGHSLRRILAFNVMGSGAFLVLVGLAQRDGTVDPVPQAMVLTGIVVAVAATALALALLRRLHALDGRGESSEINPDCSSGANPLQLPLIRGREEPAPPLIRGGREGLGSDVSSGKNGDG